MEPDESGRARGRTAAPAVIGGEGDFGEAGQGRAPVAGGGYVIAEVVRGGAKLWVEARRGPISWAQHDGRFRVKGRRPAGAAGSRAKGA
jgi:hypothetical protein